MKVFLLWAALAVSISIVLFRKKSCNSTKAIIEIAARILNSNIEKTIFGYFSVKGVYKGREMALKFKYAGGQSFYYGEVIHRGTPFKKLFQMPRPTKETYLKNDEIYYWLDIQKIKTEQDVTNIFEKLTEAAIIVEQNKPYYAQSCLISTLKDSTRWLYLS